jgi:hypothetical protein
LLNLFATAGLLTTREYTQATEQEIQFNGEDVFNRVLAKAISGKWQLLPIGVAIGKIAGEFIGTPYRADPLELSLDREICSVNLNSFDCVTFCETTLAFARMLKKGGRKPTDLLAQISLIRYRGGSIGDYSSRLHYMSDWFVDNQSKGVVKILSDLPGAEPVIQKVGFMSSHPNSYRQLSVHPYLVKQIRHQEQVINSREMKFVPMREIASAEPDLRTGDIVGVCTNQTGLDIVHTGLIYCDHSGVAHFMDASSRKATMNVLIEPGPISGALTWSKNLTGAMFARPLEPDAYK